MLNEPPDTKPTVAEIYGSQLDDVLKAWEDVTAQPVSQDQLDTHAATADGLPNIDWYERPPREDEKHGYCKGDRVGIVKGEDTGKVGHVVWVSRGCSWNDHCLQTCRLVYVLFGGEENPRRLYTFQDPADDIYSRVYLVSDVSHVD